MNSRGSAPSVALFPWGDVIEDYLDPIGLTKSDFVEHVTGGWLFGYSAALRRAGYRPLIVYGSETVQNTRCQKHRASGTPIWFVPAKRMPTARSPSALSLKQWAATPITAFREVLLREKCEALLVQEYEYTRFDVLVRLATRLGIPAFATFQGGDKTLSWLEDLVRPWSLRACAGLIIPSGAERARVEKKYRGWHPDIVDIPNPIDSDDWKPVDRAEARRSLNLPLDSCIFVNHGRIDLRRKGHDALLSAWAGAEGQELVIIGSGQDHDAFASLLAARSPRNVRWIAEYTTDRELLRRWLSAADVYVTASRLEGMPVAPLEAMACNLPVIATDAQGLPEILAGGEASGGLLVPRDDIAGIAAAMSRLSADPELRARLGQAARMRVESYFSIPAVARAIGEFLRSRVPGSRSGSDRSDSE